MNIVYMGGKQAGLIGLLTILALGHKIDVVIAYDDIVKALSTKLGLPTFASIKQQEVDKFLCNSDLLVSVHGREIVPNNQLAKPRFGGINAHPCLYRYKGTRPVERLLKDQCTKASVGVHRMTEIIDGGEVLIEEFVDVTGNRTAEETYNTLYPFYVSALIKALQLIEDSRDC